MRKKSNWFFRVSAEKNSYNFCFQYLKKFIKISKTKQHTPMTWCTYLKSFETIHQCVFELHFSPLFPTFPHFSPTKRDGQTARDRRTDRGTDRQTDRRTGGVAISPVPGIRRRGTILQAPIYLKPYVPVTLPLRIIYFYVGMWVTERVPGGGGGTHMLLVCPA